MLVPRGEDVCFIAGKQKETRVSPSPTPYWECYQYSTIRTEEVPLSRGGVRDSLPTLP